jgi:hypothetical protein
MSQFSGVFGLGQVKEIEISGDADQHALHEIQSHERVKTAGLVLGIEEQCHRQRRKPEREQELGDSRDDGDRGNIVVNTESLRKGEQSVGCDSELPERAGHAFRTPGGVDGSADQQAGEEQLNYVRERRPGIFRSQQKDHTNVSQPQEAGNGYDDAGSRQSVPRDQKCTDAPKGGGLH